MAKLPQLEIHTAVACVEVSAVYRNVLCCQSGCRSTSSVAELQDTINQSCKNRGSDEDKYAPLLMSPHVCVGVRIVDGHNCAPVASTSFTQSICAHGR